MLADVKMKDAHKAIENRRNFQIKARRSVRERLDIVWSLRGYDPMDCFGHYGPAAMNPGQSTQRQWLDIQYRIERDRARYIVESYQTVIGWERFDGIWVVPDRRYSIATGRHQRLLNQTVRNRMDYTQVITAVSALKGRRVEVLYRLDEDTARVCGRVVGTYLGNLRLTSAIEDTTPEGVTVGGDYVIDIGRVESITEQVS